MAYRLEGNPNFGSHNDLENTFLQVCSVSLNQFYQHNQPNSNKRRTAAPALFRVRGLLTFPPRTVRSLIDGGANSSKYDWLSVVSAQASPRLIPYATTSD